MVIRTFTSKSERYYQTLGFNPLKIELLKVFNFSNRICTIDALAGWRPSNLIAYRQTAIVIFTKGDMAGIGKGYTQSAR